MAQATLDFNEFSLMQSQNVTEQEQKDMETLLITFTEGQKVSKTKISLRTITTCQTNKKIKETLTPITAIQSLRREIY